MNKVLLNLANWHLVEFCKQNNIDCGGSHTEKIGRGFKYGLVNEMTGEYFATVEFTKSTAPRFARG